MATKTPAAEKPQPAKRGAKPLAAAEVVGDQIDPGKLPERNQALAVMDEHQRAVVDQFGGGLSWHADHYEAAIRGELRRGCESFLKAGSYLVVAREFAQHGEWAGMLQRLNMEPRQAQRMMEAARRIVALPNATTSSHLIGAAKSEGKLIELLSLPEDQFTELATKGETEGLALDDVADMTVRELRNAVRDARADLEAKEQRITKLSDDLNKEHDKTTKAARKWKSASPDERQVILEGRVIAGEESIRALLNNPKNSLLASVLELAEHCDENQLDCSEFLGDVFGRLLNAVRTTRDNEEIAVSIPTISDGDE